MRNIRKNAEPKSLAWHRSQDLADYNNLREKDDLRQSLVSEQGGICAYCMQRIRPTIGGMKIEHWQCRDKHEEKQLEYANMLGVCLGGENHPKAPKHCDSHKGNSELSRNPANKDHDVESVIRYLADGRIKSDDEKFDQEINKVLNLNHPLLKQNRKAVLESFRESLRRTGKLEKTSIERRIRQWYVSEGADLEEYCMVVVYYLRKRLARIAKK